VMNALLQIFQRNFSFFHEFNLRSTSTASRSKRNAHGEKEGWRDGFG
jgi:hypothetical protein